MDISIIEKLSAFTDVIPSVYDVLPKKKSGKDIMIIKFNEQNYLLVEKNADKKINRHFLLWCLGVGLSFDDYETARAYAVKCRELYGYDAIFEISYEPLFKNLRIYIRLSIKKHEKYCVYLRLDNADFSEEQLALALQNSHRFTKYDDAVAFAQRIKDKVLQIDNSLDVSIIRDTDFSVETNIKGEKHEISV